MNPTVIALAVLIVLGYLVFVARTTGMNRAIKTARKKRAIDPVLEELAKRSSEQQPVVFNQAVKQLWTGYDRELATQVIGEFVPANPQVPIGQYWIKQVLEIEPNLAQEFFPEEFLQNYYNPLVASQCGPRG